MNSLDIAFLVIAAVFIFIGAVKGLVRSVIDFFSGIISLLAALLLSRPIARVLSDMAVFDGPKEKIKDFFNEYAGSAASTITDTVNKIPIPEFIRDFVMKDVSDPSAAIANGIDSLSENLFMLMLTAAVFIVILLIVRILLYILGRSMDSLFKKVKLLDATNRFLGGLLGAANAMLITYVILAIIAMFAAKFPNLIETISDSLIVSKLYMNNLLVLLLSR